MMIRAGSRGGTGEGTQTGYRCHNWTSTASWIGHDENRKRKGKERWLTEYEDGGKWRFVKSRTSNETSKTKSVATFEPLEQYSIASLPHLHIR